MRNVTLMGEHINSVIQTASPHRRIRFTITLLKCTLFEHWEALPTDCNVNYVRKNIFRGQEKRQKRPWDMTNVKEYANPLN